MLKSIHSIIPSTARQDLHPTNTASIEILVVELNINGCPKMALVGVYNPPSACIRNGMGSAALREYQQYIQNEGFPEVYVMGDFNLPNLDLETLIPVRYMTSD